MERDGLLMRHRQHVVATGPILQAEDLLDVIALRVLPQLEWSQDGHEHLLPADRIHLLADDLDDLLVDAPSERQERPHPRRDLPDVTAANEELVRDRFGVRRRFAQGRDEQL